MRAITGRVPDHRVLASEAAEEGGASLAWPAPNDPDRAIDDLEHDLAVLKPLLDSRPSIRRGAGRRRLGEGTRPLHARSQSRAAALGHQSMGERPRRVVAERRADQGVARHRARPRVPSSRAAGVLAVGAAALRHVSLSVPAGDDLPPRALGRTGADRPDGSADAREPVPQGAGGILPRHESVRRPPDRARRPARRGRRRSARCSIAWRRSTRKRWRPPSIASGTTRSTNCVATSASGCRSSRTWPAGFPGTSSSASASPTKDATPKA